jgi:hypothetical protein
MEPLGLPRFLVGLDIGQVSDPSALAVLERRFQPENGRYEPRFDARYLERLPLQTPYPAMVRGVRERLSYLAEPCELLIDATGVGRGIVDLFREGWVTYDDKTEQRIPVPGCPRVIAVSITAGERAHQDPDCWDEWYVPKRDVVMAFMVVLQQRRFRVAKELPEAAILFKEGQNFQWKVSKAGNDQYGAWREGQHDDLLLAVALPVWWGEKVKPALQRGRGRSGRLEPLVGTGAWMG